MADYLHKPRMSSQDIVNALLIVKNAIEKSRKLKSEEVAFDRIQIADSLSKETLLKQLLSGALGSSVLMHKKLENAGISLRNHNVGCILFSVSNIGTVMKRYENAGRNVLQAFVSNIMNGILETEKGTEYLSYSENVHVIITSSDTRGSENNTFANMTSVVNLVADALMRFLNVKAVFGLSDCFQDLSSIGMAFAQASKALDMHFYRDLKTVIHYRELTKIDADETRRQIDKLVEVLKDHLSEAHFEKSLEIFDDLTKLISLNACLSKDEVKGLFNGLLFLTRGGQSSLSDMEQIALCESFSELCQTYAKIFSKRVQKDSESVIKPEYSYLVKRIMSFIKANYTNDITLKSIAEALQVSPNYVSRIFKAETGKSPFDYLNSVRIDCAKRLLADSSLKIYEIGYKVGFKSPVHFTVVFSKLIKMSPKQYRDKL